MKKSFLIFSILLCVATARSQAPVKANDVTSPLHAMKPAYPFKHEKPATPEIKAVLDKILTYLDASTPYSLENKNTGAVIELAAGVDTNTIIKAGDFRLTSYEWGVTYAAMLQTGEATGDAKYTDYAKNRLSFIGNATPAFRELYKKYPLRSNPLRQPADPKALDDAGAVCAAMIKLQAKYPSANLRTQIDHYIQYIFTKEYRLADGTLARVRPLKNTLWLDDMYMGVPAIAQMGKLTGDKKYYDDAVKQVKQFSERMFNKDLGIYMHGWVESMPYHPEFHWARANGWALLAMTELLDVLPENHPGYKMVEQQLIAHIKGLVKYQSGQGFWHQLLDREDSYLETSATAIYAYCIARAINKGRLDAKAFAPTCVLAWNAIASKVTESGQVEGTCVGTGMAFDPAFYYYRPVSVYAAHGYGPVLLAGSELINLLKKYSFQMNDSAIQLAE